ncbi:putative secreted protein [Mycobacterium kansasii]|uniref:Putative secreted protein n=1 Tax=Mycobacterium kansasii TaxID=1768 RepID=A0A1V3WYS9_MYCKA|nr:putative secreted protein [Mycobacterium kansasii]
MSLPDVPPANPDCKGGVKAHQDVPHPSLGTVRLFLVLDSRQVGPKVGCVAAAASNGKALPAITVDVGGNSLNFPNPVTDSTGNAFVTYNPGRYDGVLVLVPNPDGFQDIGWDIGSGDTHYEGKRAYYYAKLEGPAPTVSTRSANSITTACLPALGCRHQPSFALERNRLRAVDISE